MKAISIDDLFEDITDLRQLLQITYDQLMDLDYGAGETRNHRLDRVASLARIARDMAVRMEGGLGGAFPVDKSKSGEN